MSPGESGLIGPGEPSGRVFVNLGAMQLKRGQVMKRVLSCPHGGVDEGHQDIADHGAVLGFEEQAT